MKKNRIFKIFIAFLIALAGLYLAQRLLMPKYMHGVTDGALTAEYYGERMDHDVLFIGDCELYENISPITLWREYGINSYIRGSAQQLIWQSYYLLEDSLRYEKPGVLVFNVLSLQYDKPQKEAYNRMTIDGMKWSSAKAGAIRASMTEEESFISYVFPLLRYHSRWNELEEDDFTYLFKRDKVSHSGYYLRTEVRAPENLPDPRILGDYSFGDNAWKYMDMIREKCEEEGITLILVKAPSLRPYWYDEWEEQVEEYAAKYDLPYYNFLETADEYGLDMNTDTYDGGLHLNVYGAEKLSSYFGKILSEKYAVPDRRGDADCAAVWEEKCRRYDEAKGT